MAIVYGANYGRPTLDLNFAKNKSLIDTISGQNLVTFTRSSTGTYVDSDGLIKTASIDTPRFDHDPVTGVCNGLLIEESRTNLESQSVSLSTWGAIGGTIVGQNIVSPDGLSSTVQFLREGVNNGTHYMSRFYNNTYVDNCLSFYVKSNGRTKFRTTIIDNTVTTRYDLTNNTVNGVSNSNMLEKLSNGWYRVKSLYGGAYRVGSPQIILEDDSGNISYTGDGVSGIYVWGMQLEQASGVTFSTSYIPTTGSTVTRSADVASITGTNFSRWYNNTEGTAFVQTRNINSVDFSQASFIGFDGSGGIWDNVQEWGVRYNSTGNTFETAVYDSSGSSSALYNNQDARSSAKVAMGLNTTSAALSVNGNIQQVTRTGGTMPSINSLLWHSNNNPRQSTQFSRFTYYPTRLQNFQLQQITK